MTDRERAISVAFAETFELLGVCRAVMAADNSAAWFQALSDHVDKTRAAIRRVNDRPVEGE